MSNTLKYVTMKNIKQKYITPSIIQNNSHFNYHQRGNSNLVPKNNLYSKKNNRKDNELSYESKPMSNSFYNTKPHHSNNSATTRNIKFNPTTDSFNPVKHNILNISNFKSVNNNRNLNKNNVRVINRNNNINIQENSSNQTYNQNSNQTDNINNINNSLDDSLDQNLNINNEIKKKMNNEQIKNYIIYLKDNLNSSYYANNDLNNEYNKIMNKSRQINDSINSNNDIFINMNKSFEEELEKNKNFKQEYVNLVDEYKLNHLNEQNKLKELNHTIEMQDNDINKLENENNILKEDILNKKAIIENLKKKIENLKNKKIIIESNKKYLYLFNKKNILISLNQKIKLIKKLKEKNEELIENMDILKKELKVKDNIMIESQNIQNQLEMKLNQLIEDQELEKENINNINITNNINNDNNLNINLENENIEDDQENYDEKNDIKKIKIISDINAPNPVENEDNNRNTSNSIEYYKKLIDVENKKGEEIQDKINFFKDEIIKIKEDIASIKTKNSEEILSFKNHINSISPDDEEIKNQVISNKLDIINQKENLIKYNKKFKESLSEKNDLKNKINQLKIENKNIEIKLNERQKTIGFKIKAIKIRRGGKNKRFLSKEKNLSNPDLLKNSKNNNFIISQNRENFIPKKDIYRYKRFEYNFGKEKQLQNKFKSRKSGSFDNIFKFNATNAIEQESNVDILNTPRTGIYLYTIDEDGKLLGYGITLKKYVYIDTSSIKGWRLFYKEYSNNSNGSLLLNTLAGLFILTGNNYNHLYYYSQSKNIIYLIMTLKYNHKYGGLILTKDNNKIIILGGSNTNEVELFNIQKNTLKNLPSLLTSRINSSYNIIDDKYLVSFFGQNNNTIEYLDLANPTKWINFEYKTNNYIKELSGHIGFHVNENIVVIVGGQNNDRIMVFYFKEKYVDVTDFVLSFDVDCGIDELFFDKEKCFNLVENKEKKIGSGKYMKELMGMDNFGNVHCFDNDYSYTIFVF